MLMVSLQASATAAPMSRPITRVARILPPYVKVLSALPHQGNGATSLGPPLRHAASLDHDLPMHKGVRGTVIRVHAGHGEGAGEPLPWGEVRGIPQCRVGRCGVRLGAWIFAVHPGDVRPHGDPDRIGVESEVTD